MIIAPITPERSPLYSLPAMARRVNVPQKWLREEAEAGRIPALKAGSQFVFAGDVVEELILRRAAGLDAHPSEQGDAQ